jgi:hypothetical protein
MRDTPSFEMRRNTPDTNTETWSYTFKGLGDLLEDLNKMSKV